MTTDATRGQPGDTPADAEPTDEKRKNLALRLLVDEMMTTIREVARKDLWTEEERKAYERDLDRIMGRVRDEALRTSKD